MSSLEESLHFVSGIATIAVKIIWEQTKTAERIVPPVMEIDNGGTRRMQRACDLLKQVQIVPVPADESIEAKQVGDRSLEWKRQIVDPQKEDVRNPQLPRHSGGMREVRDR
jgi:hypothetical protein